ncbi:MAG: asparagine synthase-related protein [Nanoarchaeota archaeon]|nr:asparagine synthase-related protein [Nanoarchaeota archaeon]
MRTINLTQRSKGNVLLHDLFEGGLETQVLTEHRPEPAERASFTIPGLDLSAPQTFNSLNGQYHFWNWRDLEGTDVGRVDLARALVIPMRYVVLEGEKDTHVVVSDRLDKMIGAVNSLDDLRSTEFHYTYPKMVPANTVVQVTFDLEEGQAKYRDAKTVRYIEPAPQPADIRAIGEAYGNVVFRAVKGFMSQVPQGEEIGIGLSGGADSGLVYMFANKALRELGRDPQTLRAFTLKIGEGGKDVEQARRLVEFLHEKVYKTRNQWEVLGISRDALPTLEDAVAMMEDYKTTHDLQDVMVSMAFKKALRERHPDLKFMLDGQGGDELCQDYNVEETGVTLQEVLTNPHLFVEGRSHLPGRISEMFSGGLSRRVTRDYNPNAVYGFQGFSPICTTEVIRLMYGTPKAELSEGTEQGLYGLKIAFANAAAEAVTGFQYSFPQKNRFQRGASDTETRSGLEAESNETRARALFNERMESLMKR